MPTETELDTELQSWSSQDASGAFNSILKLPMGGHRRYSDGALRSVDSYGRYWSSTVYGIYARMLGFSSSSANVVEESNRAHGRSVRYIKN